MATPASTIPIESVFLYAQEWLFGEVQLRVMKHSWSTTTSNQDDSSEPLHLYLQAHLTQGIHFRLDTSSDRRVDGLLPDFLPAQIRPHEILAIRVLDKPAHRNQRRILKCSLVFKLQSPTAGSTRRRRPSGLAPSSRPSKKARVATSPAPVRDLIVVSDGDNDEDELEVLHSPGRPKNLDELVCHLDLDQITRQGGGQDGPQSYFTGTMHQDPDGWQTYESLQAMIAGVRLPGLGLNVTSPQHSPLVPAQTELNTTPSPPPDHRVVVEGASLGPSLTLSGPTNKLSNLDQGRVRSEDSPVIASDALSSHSPLDSPPGLSHAPNDQELVIGFQIGQNRASPLPSRSSIKKVDRSKTAGGPPLGMSSDPEDDNYVPSDEAEENDGTDSEDSQDAGYKVEEEDHSSTCDGITDSSAAKHHASHSSAACQPRQPNSYRCEKTYTDHQVAMLKAGYAAEVDLLKGKLRVMHQNSKSKGKAVQRLKAKLEKKEDRILELEHDFEGEISELMDKMKNVGERWQGLEQSKETRISRADKILTMFGLINKDLFQQLESSQAQVRSLKHKIKRLEAGHVEHSVPDQVAPTTPSQ